MADQPISSHIRNINNYRRGLPWLTLFLFIILIVVTVWFLRGGSFRLYASMFFGIYHLTKTAWLSIILVSVAQTLIFLPLRIIGQKNYHSIKAFEKEIAATKQQEEQYILLSKKVVQGDSPIIFYILNFVLLAMAFVSAGRVFLLDFYTKHLDPKYLYSFIPYPEYPIKGTIFNFPFFEITKTIALEWKTILLFWLYFILSLIALRFIWRLVRWIFKRNKTILQIRISYNRLLIFLSSFIGTLFIVSLFLLRHIPVNFKYIVLSADLALQNTAFNIITAICTFLATVYFNYQHQKEAARDARKAEIPENIIKKVFRKNMQKGVRNALILAIFAYIITHQMPCSHDLSVLSFEAIYVLSPVTFDLFIPKHIRQAKEQSK